MDRFLDRIGAAATGIGARPNYRGGDFERIGAVATGIGVHHQTPPLSTQRQPQEQAPLQRPTGQAATLLSSSFTEGMPIASIASQRAAGGFESPAGEQGGVAAVAGEDV